jgi:hypothetical protein
MDNDGRFPNNSWVEVRYARSRTEELTDRAAWSWLPGAILSLGRPVSRKLGYTGNGQHVVYRDDTGRITEYRLRLDRRTWETNRGDTPCVITGIKPCLTMFGLNPSAHHDDAL